MLIPKRTTALHRFLEKALRERLSLRGIARIFGLSLETVLLVLGHRARSLPALKHSVAPARAGDVLELDEMHSFVHRKKHSAVVVDRLVSEDAAGGRLRHRGSQRADVSASVSTDPGGLSTLGQLQRLLVGLGEGVSEAAASVGRQRDRRDGAGLERWNNTLRQRLGRYVRRTLSFSKTDRYHHLATKYFIWHYNLDRSINTF